jgi:hypothetical protein
VSFYVINNHKNPKSAANILLVGMLVLRGIDCVMVIIDCFQNEFSDVLVVHIILLCLFTPSIILALIFDSIIWKNIVFGIIFLHYSFLLYFYAQYLSNLPA